jgi:MoxR-like ATPase
MEEHQVTIEGETRPLPKPFFVIATQNPLHQIGTFPLPESQLDRFLLRIKLGFPAHAAERELLMGADRRDMIAELEPVFSSGKLQTIQNQSAKLHVADALLDYVQAILAFSRQSPHFEFGLSPRGGLALLNASRAWAMISGHDFVVPEHVKAVLPAVVDHRLPVSVNDDEPSQKSASQLIAESVPVP